MQTPPRFHWSCSLAVLLLVGNPMRGHAIDIEADVKQDQAVQTPVRQPVAAWRAAHAALGDDLTIRRIAFAAHGMFVFHSAPGESTIHATFFREQGGEYVGEDSGPRERSMCLSTGVTAAQVEPALRVLVRSSEWREHSDRLDGLFLECSRFDPFWSLMPVPKGGFREGVAIPTFEVPFTVSR